jgi:hypothetical protein
VATEIACLAVTLMQELRKKPQPCRGSHQYNNDLLNVVGAPPSECCVLQRVHVSNLVIFFVVLACHTVDLFIILFYARVL